MSQPSQQTRIDQFYKVISNKNTGCGVKLLTPTNGLKVGPRKNNHRKAVARPWKTSVKMSKLVESEVQIVGEKGSPSKLSQQSPRKQKRTLVSENENSPKKHKPEPDTNSSVTNSLMLSTIELRELPNEDNVKVAVLDSQKSPKKSFDTYITPPCSQNNQTPLKEAHTPLKVRSPSEINSSAKKSNFSPKVTPKKSTDASSPRSKLSSPRKLFFADRVNQTTVQQAIENLNFVRQGSIGLNEFDLEDIYQSTEFSIVYGDGVVQNSQKFEYSDIVFPKEKHADHLLMITMDVFSNAINCGYFLKSELDLIFTLFTLPPQSQMLFVRLLKRKLGWHRINKIGYQEVADNLTPFFKILVDNKLCSSDLSTIEITTLLSMLQREELKSICQKLKVDHQGKMPVLIERLMKYGNSSKTFFFGAKTPKAVLRSMVLLVLEPCICLPENIINLFDRVLTLLYPVQDPTESIADFFLTLTNIHKNELMYPPTPMGDPFPIFRNRSHLIEFVESKNAYKEVLDLVEKKEWDDVRNLGRKALEKLTKMPRVTENSTLPLHVKKFEAGYSWMKVLSRSIEAFKKVPETIPEAVNILETLIAEKTFTQSSRGRWYNELALIEMHHRKNLEKSAALTIDALQQNALTEVDVSGLLERLKKLLRRTTGISKETKNLIQEVHKSFENRGLAPLPTATKTISAYMANRLEKKGKSRWTVNVNDNDKHYGSVEVLALQHYTSKEGFSQGLHCEGSLPITLFAVFFWDELYNTFIPGAFVSPYQDAPLDLFTADFFPNRRKLIEDKLKFIRELDLESFAEWMCERYSSYENYKSVMSTLLFKSSEQFKDVVTCLGINGVTGICERLVSNYRLWRSGFPDLIVWNVLLSKCKIVEVKGPGDSLSEKQKLWLQYLEQIGISVEVCLVEGNHR
ncbi:hypothetical protein QAD02_015184 [Eretmocerus hayati]|uniref:Uncharacterized protein n=1 Tax=Eretmocerus hayati TaxID=131215 RepID=A0ACC2P7J1_9HYME|nr:hypothetical protein QAD02_015184 [Eretmocerus hayati]